MRGWMIAAAVLVLAPAPAWAQLGPMGGNGGEGRPGGHRPGGFGGRAGEARRAFRPMKPIRREAFDKAVEAMFRIADTDHDGIVTPAELHAILDARRDAILRKRFESVDANHDKRIDETEFLAWQRRMGDAALTDDQADSDADTPLANAIRPPVKGDDMDDRVLRALIEPISGMTLAQANSNYDAGVSLEELLAYEGKRFEAADTNKDGALDVDEVRATLRGGEGRRRFGGRARPAGAPPEDAPEENPPSPGQE